MAKVAYPDFRKSNTRPKTFDCVFIGYAQNSAAYRFMCINDYSICEYRDAEFFEFVFPMNRNIHVHVAPSRIDLMNESESLPSSIVSNANVNEPRRSKRKRIENSFGPYYKTDFLVENSDKIINNLFMFL